MGEKDVPRADAASVSPSFVALVVGFALFTCSTWSGRSDAAVLSAEALYCARFAKIATYLVVALLFRSHIPNVPSFYAASVALFFLGLCVDGASRLVVSLSVPIVMVASVLEGVSGACVLLLFAHGISTFKPGRSAVAFAAAYLLNEVLLMGLMVLPPGEAGVCRALFKVMGVFLLGLAVLMLSGPAGEGDHPLQYGIGCLGGEVARPLRFLSESRDWALLLVVSALFPAIFGVVAQLCSGTESHAGLYDTANEVPAVILLAAVLVLMRKRQLGFGFSQVMVGVTPFFVFGCALFPLLWSMGSVFAGTLVKCGWTLLNTLLMVLLARKSYEDPRHTYLYFGLFCCVSTAQGGRLAGSALMARFGLDYFLVSSVALLSLCLVSLCLLLTFVASRRQGSRWEGDMEPPEGGGETQAASESLDEFPRKLEAFFELHRFTAREREVVTETVHGYSRDNVARKLHLSPETVKTYLRRSYERAGVSSKQELIAKIERTAIGKDARDARGEIGSARL